MAGKTTIDTDLRNEVVEFLRNLGAQDTEPVGFITAKARAIELYWAMKPQRTRDHRPVKESVTNGPIAAPIQYHPEFENVENIQPSQ